MEVILKQDVSNLGHKDDIVRVKDGYARNFLIPRKFATAVTPSIKKMHEEIVKQRKHKEDKLRNEALASAEKMKDVKVTIFTKTSTKGKIFGSVTNIQIAEALEKLGYSIDRRSITIKDEHIKEVGTYKAKIKIYKDIAVEVTFEIVSE